MFIKLQKENGGQEFVNESAILTIRADSSTGSRIVLIPDTTSKINGSTRGYDNGSKYYVPRSAETTAEAYYALFSPDAVRRAIELCHAYIAREESSTHFRFPTTNAPEEPLRTWSLDLTDPKQIQLVETEILLDHPDKIISGDVTIAIKRPATATPFSLAPKL